MDRLVDEGIVLRDTLSFYEVAGPSGNLVAVALTGRLTYRDRVTIRVDKKMEIRRDASNRYEVRTRYYQYHAWRRATANQPRRDLIRYDNAHSGALHAHLFDADGHEVARPEVALHDLPSLDGFVRHAVALAEN